MPLRKKHVRRIVLAILAVGVIGPLLVLGAVGLWLHSGAYARGLKVMLESRLRCEAQVRGARPTGPDSAAADEVLLVWTTSDGQLVLRLADITAQFTKAYGWRVTAADGELSLTGPRPDLALAALNQRLVQMENPSHLMMLQVRRLHLALDFGHLNIETDAQATALPHMTALLVHFRRLRAAESAEGETEATEATIRLNPTSVAGVFGGLHANLKDIPLATVARALKLDKLKVEHGSMDLTVDWHGPDSNRAATCITADIRQADLAEWAPLIPDGAVQGTVDHMRIHFTGISPVNVQVETGEVAPQTMEWLEGLPQTFLKAPAATPAGENN